MTLPGRKADDFHLLLSNLKIETGKTAKVEGKQPERSVVANLKKLQLNIKERATGELDVMISRAPEATVSAR